MPHSIDPLVAARPSLGAGRAALAARVLGSVVSTEPLGGRYRLGRVLGSGAFGVVYVGHDLELDRKVAIKQLRSPGTDATACIVEEARALATVSHPNVVQVFEVGEDTRSNTAYAVMEFVEGEALDVWIRARGRAWTRVVELVVQAARGLAAAHARGVVHRDVKPANLLFGDDGRLRVVDFGLAAVQLSDSTQDDDAVGGSTQVGMAVGTPAYLAPEGFAGRSGPASDQFSLAAVLFEGLTGRRAVLGSTLDEIRGAHRRGIDLPATLPGPRALRRVLARGLRREPTRRFEDMDAFADALEDVLRPRGSWTLAVAGSVAALLAGVAWAGAERTDASCTTDPAVWSSALEHTGTNENVRVAVTDYARRWKEAEREACRDRERLPAGVRLCFDGRRSDAEALIHVHGEGWSDHEAAVRAVEGLADPTDCLAEDEERKGPAATSLDAVAAVQPMLSRLRALTQAAKLEESLRYSKEVLDAARSAGFTPMIVEAASLRARALMVSSNHGQAREVYEEVYFAARKANMPKAAADAASNLTFLIGSNFGDLDAAHRWAEHAGASYARAEIDPTTVGIYMQGLISVAQREGNYSEQERLARAAEQVELDAGRPDSEVRATMVGYRGIAQYLREDYEAALESFELGTELAEARYGPRTAPVSALLDNRALVLRLLDRPEESLPLAEEAFAIRKETYPADSVDMGFSFGNLSVLYADLGRFDEALDYADRALAIFEAKLPPSSGELGRSYKQRSEILRKRGKEYWGEALEDAQTARVIFGDAGAEYAAEAEALEVMIAEMEAAQQ